jgi:ELWxxDGT repeat protein
VTDGTGVGTRVVADVWPGALGSNPSDLAAQQGGVYFAADDGSSGRELWWSDGTAAGTRRVADARPGPVGSDPRAISALGARRVLFVAADAIEGDEPWLSDGSAAGTRRLAALRPGPAGSGVDAFTVRADGRVLFVADDGSTGREPWTFDPGAVAVRISASCGVGVTTLACTDPVLGSVLRIDGRHDSGGMLAGTCLLSSPREARYRNCPLLVDPLQVAVPLALSSGAFALNIPLPNVARLLGVVWHAQAVVGPFAAPPGLSLSEAFALRLGS